MSIFQKSVINKHLKNIDKEQVEKAFEKFKENYSLQKITKIIELKEEEYQDGFLRDIFVDVLGYTLKPDNDYNLAREFKNQTDGKKADGAILGRGHDPLTRKAIAVIELKSTKTKDLTNVTQQAFNYKNNQPECKYIITSNFQKLRFYIDYSNEYEEFDLFNLQKDDFQLFYLLMQKDSILTDLPLKLKTETKFHEENISDKLYKDYSSFKYKIYNNLVKNNSQYDKLTLFKKSQKFLDRLLFVFFAEDTGLVPPNAISKIVDQWQLFIDNDEYFSLYSRFVKFFNHLDKGHKYKTYDLPAYNGGLFAPDEILDNITIDDDVLKNDALLLSSYDYSTEVDVNILGHIFEHSLNEIAAIAATMGHAPLAGTENSISKRKKDGVFYTPKYITQYIVENTIGKLCIEKREKLGIIEIEFDESIKTKNGKISATGKKLFQKLQAYKDWLFNLKIVDPACGSGAFLNQALNFLINEHQQIDDIIVELTGEKLRLFDTDKTILEKNLYGVDINEESVEIAKLSLWLHTAQKGRKLSNLNSNIKCGNSLIDDPEVAGEKAFNWQKEFPGIFQKKKKKAWHVTTATHNSRYSQRMFDNFVKLGEPVWLSEEEEIIVTKTIAEIVEEDKLNIIAYNICGDHAHLILVCEEDELPKIVQKIKSMSARACNIAMGRTIPETMEHAPSLDTGKVSETTEHISATEDISAMEHAPLQGQREDASAREHAPLQRHAPMQRKRGKTQSHLWTQKFGHKEITSDKQLQNTIAYIRNNRNKHELLENKGLRPIIQKMTCTRQHAFRTEYKGGFDVVIGNPPYVDIKGLEPEIVKTLFKKYSTTENRINLYSIFIEKGYSILKNKGFLSFINPNSILVNSSYTKIRNLLIDDITTIIKLPDDVFPDAKVETIIFELRKGVKHEFANTLVYPKETKIQFIDKDKLQLQNKKFWKQSKSTNYNIYVSDNDISLIQKCEENSLQLGNIADFSLGITPYDKYHGHSQETIKNRSFHSKTKIDDLYKPLISGGNITRYFVSSQIEEFIKYGDWLGAMREERFFTSPRIIIRQIVSGKPPRIYAGFTDQSYYFTQIGFGIIPKPNIHVKYLLSLLNSSIITYYHKYKFLDLEKELFQKILIANCKQFPIKSIPLEEQQIFVSKADIIIELNQELQRKKNKFSNRLKANMEIEKISKKLEKFYDYDFKTFVAELKKQKVKLSLVQQDEWEEYFNSYKSEINQLQIEINKTDKKIDQMVYHLYNLTDDEIAIVENSIK